MYINPSLEANVIRQVRYLDQNWFERKKAAFVKEVFYKTEKDRIIESWSEISNFFDEESDQQIEEKDEVSIDIDIVKYSWNSYYPGSNLNHEEERESNQIVNDSYRVSRNLIVLIERQIELFTDIRAINTIIIFVRDIVISEMPKMKSQYNSSEYSEALDYFVSKFRFELRNEYSHISKQLRIIGANTLYNELTIEICNKIADFKLRGTRFITSASPINRGEALHNLLTLNSPLISNLNISIEDWFNQDAYYLIYLIDKHFSDSFTITMIENKDALVMKNRQMFKRSGYYDFSSTNLESYLRNRKNQSIDDQMLQIVKS